MIELDNAGKAYASGQASAQIALHPISLRIERGDFVCVAGPSGSGKTTLLHLMGGLTTPTSGRVTVNGRNLTGMKRAESALFRRYNLGFVFQAFNLIPVLTAYENVAYVLLLQNVKGTERHQRTFKALQDVGLTEYHDAKPAQLSGGQQQRVAVARAIVGAPAVVLADEPTGNLDSETGGALISLLREINQQQGTTFVFSSHDPQIIAGATRVIRLRDGLLVK